MKSLFALSSVLAVVFGVFHDSAYAGIGRFSGRATNISDISFDINTDAPKLSYGFFSEAIQNLSVQGVFNFSNTSGDLKVSKLTTDSDGKIADLVVGFDSSKITPFQLGKVLEIRGSNIDFLSNVYRYDVSINGTSPAPEIIWFVQSNDSSLVNDLSAINKFNVLYGIIPSDITPDGNNGGTFTLNLESFSDINKIPEPSTIFGLITVGSMGVLSVIKQKRQVN